MRETESSKDGITLEQANGMIVYRKVDIHTVRLICPDLLYIQSVMPEVKQQQWS